TARLRRGQGLARQSRTEARARRADDEADRGSGDARRGRPPNAEAPRCARGDRRRAGDSHVGGDFRMTAERCRRILGIDPGLRVTGFGVLELHGTTLVYVTSGCIRATGTSLPIRLGVIARDLAHVIAELAPAEVAVEKVFVNVNPNSTLSLGQARGAAIAAAVLAGLPVTEYTAG